MDAAPGSISQVSARVQFHIVGGQLAAVAPWHHQPVLWSSPHRVAGADLIPQRASSGSIAERN